MRTVDVVAADLAAGRFSAAKLATARTIMREDGIVCLKQAVSIHSVDRLNEKMQADLDRRTPGRSANAWNSLRPPPFAPHLFDDIVYNEFAIDVCREVLGEQATLTTYGANTSWPEQDSPQPIHRDVPDAPIVDACPAVVINIPLMDFTVENGATLVYVGSHRSSVSAANGTRKFSQGMLDGQAALHPPEQTVNIRRGDLVIRDLRLWHGGMPNRSNDRRIMLALVVIDPLYRGGDESGFKGFEAEQGSEAFWHHPRMNTSVHFVPPGDRSYYMHGHHSTPPTELRVDWERRTQSQ